MTRVRAGQVFRDPVLFLAFGFGAGLAPKAPGTAGTLVAVPLYLWLSQFSQPVYLAAVAAVAVAGVAICGRAAATLRTHDHPGIVWDEFAGYLVTMIPASGSWISLLAGFMLFRLFDIWKPWPISVADKKISGGAGIMLDDLLAGIPAAIGVALVARWLE
ncbi:MAG: phosphatidylglycerophosphatase A [Thiogranum sp.]